MSHQPTPGQSSDHSLPVVPRVLSIGLVVAGLGLGAWAALDWIAYESFVMTLLML